MKTEAKKVSINLKEKEIIELPYDKFSPKSIENYSKGLVEKTFREVLGEGKEYKGKGGLGQLLEEKYFLYKPNSDKNPDFLEAGVELKVTPFKQNKNKSFVAKERLVLNIINYMEIIDEEFETSCFWNKNKLLLLVHYFYKENIDKLDYVIKNSQLFTYNDEDLAIIREDWNKIKNKIENGKAHELSEGDTFYLGACTKGGKETKDRKQPNNTIKAKQRAFSLKNKFMTYVLNDYILKGKNTYESIVKNKDILKNTTFEKYIIDKIIRFKGMSANELANEFDVKIKSKHFTSIIAMRMLGIKSNKATEFEKANIKIKAIRVENDNTIEQHMSFPVFKFKEIINEKWDTCSFREYLTETKFLFIIFKFNEENELILKGSMFWNMPYSDLENDVKMVWKKTRNIIKCGVEINKKGKKQYNNLPAASENDVCHVRPHARDSSDIDILPDGRTLTKQCFWLNNNYILQQILYILEK
ncbi:Sau3AI family type II restriction endonuclease [Clostridium sp. SHJSY1]|uniref:Sau3AI family type II restriction endonuclease n=1 Tax=Clostridium sp. SHJSY1 TaxID=2942483 RepID=UPI0028748119|nr:Sau3AI family type II restriction endonuclease [Clostridium sp. SHJSY1]MDS0527589.1 Sau3AI family type II restriction endonuclease [Clostridium sp. SHJSY1]